MTVLDRPLVVIAPKPAVERQTLRIQAQLTCIVCHRVFDLVAGQTAIVLKHIAYGYDFVHSGVCEATAREWIFVEPGYDRPAFAADGARVRILCVSSAAGWAAALPAAPEQVVDRLPILYEPLAYWAAVEYPDGSVRTEGVVRHKEWLNEPGGAEFPEARCGRYTSQGYLELVTIDRAASRVASPKEN